MLSTIFSGVARCYSFLARFAPGPRLVSRILRRDGLKWGVSAMLVATRTISSRTSSRDSSSEAATPGSACRCCGASSWGQRSCCSARSVFSSSPGRVFVKLPIPACITVRSNVRRRRRPSRSVHGPPNRQPEPDQQPLQTSTIRAFGSLEGAWENSFWTITSTWEPSRMGSRERERVMHYDTQNDRERRQLVIAHARRSSELEGSRSTDATRGDQDAYVRGEIDIEQLGQRVRARYGVL